MVDWTLKSISFSFSNWSSSLLALCHSCPQSSSRYPHSCTWISYSQFSQESDPENMCVCVCVYAWACVYLWHIIITDHVYIVLFSVLKQTHCTRMWSIWVNSFLQHVFEYPLKWCTYSTGWHMHQYIHTYIYIHTHYQRSKVVLPE